MSDIDRDVADLEGLPRKNGELVFAAPWEGRAFGLAVLLRDQGTYAWGEFRDQLIERVAEDADRPYYESWLGALEGLLAARGLLSPDEVAARAAEFRELRRDALDL